MPPAHPAYSLQLRVSVPTSAAPIPDEGHRRTGELSSGGTQTSGGTSSSARSPRGGGAEANRTLALFRRGDTCGEAALLVRGERGERGVESVNEDAF